MLFALREITTLRSLNREPAPTGFRILLVELPLHRIVSDVGSSPMEVGIVANDVIVIVPLPNPHAGSVLSFVDDLC